MKDGIGHAPWFAQSNRKHDSAKPLKRFGGAGVLEVVESFEGNTYRAAYTVKFEGFVYVLHCFQKKSKRGRRTPRIETDLIRSRLQLAEAVTTNGERQTNPATANRKREAHRGTGNVFADIGVRDPEEMLVKEELSARIVDIIRARGLTQTAAAKVLDGSAEGVGALPREDSPVFGRAPHALPHCARSGRSDRR